MIKETTPLSMAEALEYVKKEKEGEVNMLAFIKKFTKMEHKTAKEIREKIQKMDSIKIKPEHISKIIDILPETQEDLNKIFVDVSLNEDESKKILDTIKEFR